MKKLNSINFTKWQYKNLLAVDFGTQFSGLATFCPGRDPFPTPYGRIDSQGPHKLKAELHLLVKREHIDLLILGLPLLVDGTESEMTRRIRNFGKSLKGLIHPIPLEFQDETLTSFAAKERMQNSPQYNFTINLKEIDAVAATIILEDFMKK